MSGENKKRYRLYATKTNEERIKYAMKQRFHRISWTYILIYIEEDELKKEELNIIGYRDISENGLAALSEGDKEWLFHCNSSLILEDSKANEDLFLADIEDKIAKLEKVLEEQSKLTGEN